MSRILNRPVKVVTGPGGCPRLFYWKQRWQKVSGVLEEWRDTGRWWEQEGEKVFYQVETEAHSLYELFLDLGEQKWTLYRVYD